MRFVPPLVMHGAHRVSDAELESHSRRYTSRLLSYPHWPELADMEAPEACDVPAEARPEEG